MASNEHVLELDSTNRDAWVDYAETLFEDHRFEEALQAYRSALDLSPENAGAYFQQAKALFALGRPEESIRSLKTAFRLDPDKKTEFAHTYPDLYRDARIRTILGLDRLTRSTALFSARAGLPVCPYFVLRLCSAAF